MTTALLAPSPLSVRLHLDARGAADVEEPAALHVRASGSLAVHSHARAQLAAPRRLIETGAGRSSSRAAAAGRRRLVVRADGNAVPLDASLGYPAMAQDHGDARPDRASRSLP